MTRRSRPALPGGWPLALAVLTLAVLAPASAGAASHEAGAHAEEAAHAEPTKPAEEAAHAEPAKPAEAAGHAESTKPAEEAAHAEPARPAEGATPEGRPAGAGLAPSEAMRAFQRLQDQVAHGNKTAQAAQAKMLAHVADVFAAADPAAWKEPRNADAAALYLFSAGKAKTVRALVEQGAVFAADRDRLVKGALAYAEGQDEVARALLGKYDPRSLPRALGGHLALVLGTMSADKDPGRAETMLDAARLLVPGTLVEEAALRRQVFLLADVASLDKFTALSRQYMRRFRGSVYAANFKARLTSFAVRLAVAGDVAQLSKVDTAFVELAPAERRSLFLTLARDALLAGRADTARYAAGRAAALSPDAADAERVRLYTAAAGVASDASPEGRAALAGVDRGRLSARDAELQDAALAVATSIDGGLGDRGQDLGRDGAASDGASATLIDRARRAMAAGDVLLAVDPGLPKAAPGPAGSPVAASPPNGDVP